MTNPESGPPTPEEWLEYQQGKLSESQSLKIEFYVEKYGLPQELASLQPESADDSLVNQLREVLADQNENNYENEIQRAAATVKAEPGQINQLIENFPDIAKSFNSGPAIDHSEIAHYRIIS
ncbi:MAG: hypothetical protein ACKO85_10915, partial [Isosphaeraceae bacterium]